MNKRIKELAAEYFDVRNGVIVSPVDGYADIEEELQKFAKLIVQECADIAWSNEPDGEISSLIKEHFGVK